MSDIYFRKDMVSILQKRTGATFSTTETTFESDKKSTNLRETSTKGKVVLVSWDELAEWQKDNEHIHKGYVSETNSILSCIHSLFIIHNESVNIYTHLLPGICFLLTLFFDFNIVKKFPTTAIIDYFIIDLFLFGVFACLIMSSIFHCLKAHSSHISKVGNKLDYLGIVILITTSMISILFYGFHDNSKFFYFFSAITVIFGILCGFVSLKDKFRSREWRPYRASLFVIFGLSAVFPILVGIFYYGLEETKARVQLNWIASEGFLYIFGAMLYGVRFPERIMPGYFDIWGHSHQIFHVLVVIAALCHLRGLMESYELVHEKLSL